MCYRDSRLVQDGFKEARSFGNSRKAGLVYLSHLTWVDKNPKTHSYFTFLPIYSLFKALCSSLTSILWMRTRCLYSIRDGQIVSKYLLPNCGQHSSYSINSNDAELTIEVTEGSMYAKKCMPRNHMLRLHFLSLFPLNGIHMYIHICLEYQTYSHLWYLLWLTEDESTDFFESWCRAIWMVLCGHPVQSVLTLDPGI